MKGWLVGLMLLAAPATAATTATPKQVLQRDRLVLQGALSDWTTFLKETPGGERYLPELEAFKGRTKRAKSLEEFRPVEVEFDAWKRDTLARLKPGAWMAADGQIDISRAQVGAFQELSFARKQAVNPAEIKVIDNLRGMVGGAQDWEDLGKLYDQMGRYHAAPAPAPAPYAQAGSAPWWTQSYQPYRPTPFKSDINLIAAKASVPPPAMVGSNRVGSYQKMVSYLTQVAHSSGLYQKLVSLGVDPLPFLLAMVKSESEFSQYAVSHAGAYGYMQVLVPTAKGTLQRNRAFYEQETGKKLNTRAITGRKLLDDWKMNVIAGTLYLKEQVERFDGLVRDLPTPREQGKMLINLVASAYNAGEAGLTKFLLGKRRVTWNEVANVEDSSAARAVVRKAAADPKKSVVGYRETRGYVRKIQDWYEHWSESWSAWKDSRVPPSVPA